MAPVLFLYLAMKNKVVFIILILLSIRPAQAQDTALHHKSNTIKQKITNKDFTFVATYVISMRSFSRSIASSHYDLSVHGDSLVAYLPFFGVSYTAPTDPSQSPFDFTLTHFSYIIKPRKKGGWDISIKPKDQTNVQKFLLTAYDNGSASLNITSTNRDPISYNGYIEE